MEAQLKHIDEVSNFDEEVLKSKIPVVVDFWAEWCGPCQKMLPILNLLANEFQNKIRFIKVNISDHPEIAQNYNITGIPTLILFEKGQIKKTLTGFSSKEMLAKWLSS